VEEVEGGVYNNFHVVFASRRKKGEGREEADVTLKL
jgi:hypothetical protein